MLVAGILFFTAQESSDEDLKPPLMVELATEGRFAYEGLDRVIHERARLSVLTSLLTNPRGLTFGDLWATLRPNGWQSKPAS